MKSKMKRRMLAIVLCMVIVLSNSSFIFASSESGTPAVEAASTEGTTSQTETDTQVTEPTPQTLAVSESTPAPTDEPAAPTSVEATPTPTDTPEVTTTPEPTGTPTPEATPTPTDTPEPTGTPEPTDTPETTTTPQPTDAPETTTTPEPTDTPEATPTPTQGAEDETSDIVQPTATPTPTEAPVKSNEAVELKQEFKDSDGNVTSTVKAQIPEGTFAADASGITMEVQTPDTASAEHVKEMMEELLPENHMLGDYIFYDIQFKVNGTVTEPQKPITITFEGEELSVKDVKRANVFWLDPEDPQVDGDKDQLVEITQKSEMIENLQNSGQSTENIDDYDLSEITLKEDGTSDKIQMEGRTSTIYGCYVVYEPVQVLTYDDDQVTVTVSAAEEGIIPANAELKVVPITAEDKNTEDQYKEVEQKLQEKAEEDAYDIAGFLAYDITFVDEDGNETEPSGEVKVSIDYKEAAIPEVVSEEDAANAEVTVLHLEEDEKGEVKEVVDMAQNEKGDVLATTEENKVEKAEVRTESFSTFTITWWKSGKDLEIKIIDSNGKEICQDQEASNIWGDNGVSVGDIAEKYKISGYKFDKAVVGKNIQSSSAIEAAGEITKLRYADGNWEYRNKNSWNELSGKNTVYFVYTSSQLSQIGTIETVDSRKDGIMLNLFDYNSSGQYNNINSGKDFQFTDGYAESNTDVNTYHDGEGENAVFDGIFERNMAQQGGKYTYPLFTQNYNDGEDASYLFSTEEQVAGKTVYPDVNLLFKKNEDGYYVYNSNENYAYYQSTGENEGNFIVYDVPAAPSGTAACYTKGNFFPFNTLAADSDVKNMQTGLRNFETGTGATSKNTHFGMTMSASFFQPADGKISEKPMVFNFTGDDDVWVFIDGVLVLDIGGIHDALSGSIDFSTGTVKVTGQNETNLKALFDAARRNANTGFDGNTFSDYTEHTIHFYYLERGQGASNCKLEFNLPTLPEDRITVGKEITDSNASVYSDVEFSFKLEIKNESGVYEPVKNTEVKVYDVNGNYIRTCQVDSGEFKLKDGEFAYFTGHPVNTIYRVTETGVSSSEYDDISIVGIPVYEVDGGESTNSWQTGDLILSQNHLVVFQNRIAAENKRELQITKEIADDDGDTEYQIKVFLGSEATQKDGTPYTGIYYVDTDGDGEKEDYTAEDGIIRIKKDQTAAIVDIPSGTSFKVVEVGLDSEKYNSPSYSIVPGTAADINSTDEYAFGKLILTADAQVTVTNALKAVPDNPYIEIEKKFEGINNPEELLSSFAIKVYSDPSCVEEHLITTLTLQDITGEDNTFVWKLDNLEAGTYYLRESDYTIGNYEVTTTINSNVVTQWPVEVKTQAPELESVGDLRGEDTCSNKSFDFLNNYNFVVASLKESKNYFVWSAEPLSAGERQAIRSFAASDSSFNQITSSDATIDFYSGLDNLQNGITINGGTIKVTEPTALGVRTLSFVSSTNQWQHVLFGQYQIKPGVNAEIEITNSYTPKTVEIDLQKYGTKYEMDPLTGAKFELYKAAEDKETDDSITITKGSRIAEYDITNAHELSLESGYYILKETQAPVGYQLLNDEILFKVENQQVKLLKGSYDTNSGRYTQVVEEQDNVLDMWKVELVGNTNTITIKIKNKALYDLPSAGSSGIFGYMMGGTLLLMAGTLILYKMKRKEVQES